MDGYQPTGASYRWVLIAAAFVTMMVISIYQYSWFLFAYALQKQRLWDLPTISLTFTVFAYAATFVQPLSGFIADSYGPRRMAMVASCLVGLGLILASYASTPGVLYVFYGLGSLGVGVLYGISTACAIKWFPERRGLATGLVVFGFGAGTALFNGPIQGALETQGLSATFMGLGLLMMIVLIPLSVLYRYPHGEGASGSGSGDATAVRPMEFRPLEMMKTHQWFLIYFSFTVTVSIVLIFGAHMKMLAQEFDLPKNWFNALLVIFPVGNGLSRIVAGTVSDRIGRERTMVIFYSLLGVSILSLVIFGQTAIVFVSMILIASLFGGAPFVLYPATIGDYYGARYSTANYGITYTAKAWAGLIAGWLGGYLAMQFGSYKLPLLVMALSSLGAAIISSPRLLKAPAKEPRS